MQARLLRDRDLEQSLRRAVRYRAELAAPGFPEAHRQRVQRAADASLAAAGEAAQHQAGRLLRMVRDQLTQAQIIRFEILPSPPGCTLGQAPLRARTLGLTHRQPWRTTRWPHNGEFWSDELGYYQVELVDRCY